MADSPRGPSHGREHFLAPSPTHHPHPISRHSTRPPTQAGINVLGDNRERHGNQSGQSTSTALIASNTMRIEMELKYGTGVQYNAPRSGSSELQTTKRQPTKQKTSDDLLLHVGAVFKRERSHGGGNGTFKASVNATTLQKVNHRGDTQLASPKTGASLSSVRAHASWSTQQAL